MSNTFNEGKVSNIPQKIGIIGEFKKFITRGNVIDLAVGVIIGGAFQKIINSLVNDIIMPLVGLVSGGYNFNDRFIVLGKGSYPTQEAAKSAGVATLNYGTFLTNLLDFFIIAIVIFLMVKGINKLSDMKSGNTAGNALTTKKCPYCKSDISVDATKCPQCTSQI
jgi:large conductance mechanosensitive channel